MLMPSSLRWMKGSRRSCWPGLLGRLHMVPHCQAGSLWAMMTLVVKCVSKDPARGVL
jgi:hypothetical protein